MIYIPSPIAINYRMAFQALANKSGRMQYYCLDKSGDRKRITRTEFIDAYNNKPVLAMRPIQDDKQKDLFQLEFYIR